MTSTGPSALAQSDKMGKYHLFGYYNRKPAYQHESGLDYLFYAEGEAWVIGAMFGGARVGIVNFDKHPCPYELKSLWRHSGKQFNELRTEFIEHVLNFLTIWD